MRVLDVDLAYWDTAEGSPLMIGPRVVRTLRGAGVLETFADGGEALPGVRARSAPGHCTGHCVLEVAGDEGVLLYLADVIHHPLHVEHPEWDALYDRLPEEALATRVAFIDEAETRGAVVLASHIDRPGRIERARSVARPGWTSRVDGDVRRHERAGGSSSTAGSCPAAGC